MFYLLCNNLQLTVLSLKIKKTFQERQNYWPLSVPFIFLFEKKNDSYNWSVLANN